MVLARRMAGHRHRRTQTSRLTQLGGWSRHNFSNWKVSAVAPINLKLARRHDKQACKRSTSHGRRASVEWLEERRLLATFMVNSLADTGSGSLREALLAANAAPGPDNIVFQAGLSGNISLSTGELLITDSVAISGAGAAITVDGSKATRVFNVDDGLPGLIDVVFNQLTITDGDALRGGAIRNREGLTLRSSIVSGSAAEYGGGIESIDGATLRLEQSAVSGNSATYRGGGIYSSTGGSVTLFESTVDDNSAGTQGGGIVSGPATILRIESSQVLTNTATDRGGGIYAGRLSTAYGAQVTITQSTISGNVGDDGGGMNAGPGTVLTVADSFLTDNQSNDRGGALHISALSSGYETRADITNTLISGNSAIDDGGAIASGTGVTLNVTDSTIQMNSATSRGGALYISGTSSPFTSFADITRTTIRQNSSDDDGGGIHAGSATVLNIRDSSITENYAYDNGGGMRVTGFGSAAYPNVTTITGSTISGNTTNDRGGGIYNGSATTTTIEDSTVSGNAAKADAGGLAVLFGGSAIVRRSTFFGNQSDGRGGAIEADGSSLSIFESTISGNTAATEGGGVALEKAQGTNYLLMISGSTITNNLGDTYGSLFPSGGGIYASQYADLILSGSIVAGNRNADGSTPDILHASSAIQARYNLIGDNTDFPQLPEANPDADGNFVGGPIGGVIDPLLGPLTDNGGPTLTHLPLSNSPAIDRGDPSVVSGTDQRGLNRVFNNRVDIGAVEVQPTLPDGDFNDDGLYDCADIDALTEAISLGTNPPAFDLNGDMLVNLLDRDTWLSAAGSVNLGPGLAYLLGDATLDGFVDISDFNLWNSNKFSMSAAWCRGDFDASGSVDVSDFNSWNANKFRSSFTFNVPPPTDTTEQYRQDNRIGTSAARADQSLVTELDRGRLANDDRAREPVAQVSRGDLATVRRRRFGMQEPASAQAVELGDADNIPQSAAARLPRS